MSLIPGVFTSVYFFQIVKLGTPLTGSRNDATPLRTPMGATPFGQTPKKVQTQIRSDLRARLSALPKPSNELEVVMPDEEDEKESADAVRWPFS